MSSGRGVGGTNFVQLGTDDTALSDRYARALVGDRGGLIYLRDQIDIALTGDDEVLLNQSVSGFSGIKIANRLPRAQIIKQRRRSKALAVLAVVVVCTLVVLGLFRAIAMLAGALAG